MTIYNNARPRAGAQGRGEHSEGHRDHSEADREHRGAHREPAQRATQHTAAVQGDTDN